MVLFLSINLIVFGRTIINFMVNHLNMSDLEAVIWLVLRWPVAFAALFFMAFLSYYILPDLRGNERFKRKVPFPEPGFLQHFGLWVRGVFLFM